MTSQTWITPEGKLLLPWSSDFSPHFYGPFKPKDIEGLFTQDDKEGFEWSAYQFEHDDDRDPIWAGFLSYSDEIWNAEVKQYWDSLTPTTLVDSFDRYDEAVEWVCSWACPIEFMETEPIVAMN